MGREKIIFLIWHQKTKKNMYLALRPGTSADEVHYYPVRMDKVDQINAVISRHSAITVSLGMIIPRIGRDGVEFVANSGSETGNETPVLTEAVTRLLKREWDTQTEKIITALLIDGFAVVRRMRSEADEKYFVPSVLSSRLYSLCWRFDPRTNRRYYKPFWRNLDDYRGDMPKNGDPVDDAHVIVLYAPSEYDGDPDSPVSRVTPEVLRLAVSEDAATYALYHQAHPPFVYSMSPQALTAGTRDPGQGPIFNLTDITKSKMLQTQIQRREARGAMMQDSREAVINQLYSMVAQQQSQLIQMQDSMGDTGSHIPTSIAAQRYAAVPPHFNMVPLTAGQELETAPVPAITAQYTEITNSMRKTIMMMLGVNPQLAGVERANYAANSELAFGVFNDAIRSYQQRIEPLLAEIFEFVYELPLSSVEAEVEEEQGDRPGLEQQAAEDKKRKTQITAHSAPKRIKYAGSGLKIKAKLRSTPWTTMESLEKLFHYGIIDHEMFKKHAVNLVGMHEDCISDIDLKREDFLPPPPQSGSGGNAAKGSASSAARAATTPSSH